MAAEGSAHAQGSRGAGRLPPVALLAALLYVAAAAVFPWSKPGLHYDEALFLRDAVQMLGSPAPPPFTHGKRAWVAVAGRALPVMDLPYAGAVKAYLMLVPFALFGTAAGVARAAAVSIAAFGIWGIARTLAREVSPGAGAAAGALLAVHPALVAQTLYDNSAVALWVGCTGLVALALSRFGRSGSASAAATLGAAAGLAVWGRLNFLWLLGAAAVSAAVFARPLAGRGGRRAVALGAGFAVGCAPVAIFETVSRFATLRFMGAARPESDSARRVLGRLVRMVESLLSDAEHRAIWNGPPVPRGEIAFAAILFAAGIGFALFAPRGNRETDGQLSLRRTAALTTVLFASIMLASGLGIAQHHLVTVVPIALPAAVLGFRRAASGPRARAGAIAAGAAFAVVAVSLDVQAAAGIRRTGGTGPWSDAIESVTAALRSEAPGSAALVLSWGLANNTFVLSGGEVSPVEIFPGASVERSGTGASWSDEVARGGTFLLGLPNPAVEGFRAALAASGRPFRKRTFRERDGAFYAELIDVPAARPANPAAPSPSARRPESLP